MKVYLLWFHEWEDSYVLGVFESKEQAEHWKSYFLANPIEDDFGPDMVRFSKNEPDWGNRFAIDEHEVGSLTPGIKIDNLKYVEHLFTENENAPETGRTEPTEG